MHRIALTIWSVIISLTPLPVNSETLVDGVVAVITFHQDDARKKPVQEVLLFSDLERYRLFFEADHPGATDDAALWQARLNEVIGQTLLKPEAARFILKTPTEKEVGEQLRRIRLRFKNEAAYDQALLQSGLSVADLRIEIRQFLWVQKLIQERILEFIFISPKEVVGYYVDHLKNYVGKPFEEIEKEIETRLVKEKGKVKKAAYIKRLKGKVEVNILLNNVLFGPGMNGA